LALIMHCHFDIKQTDHQNLECRKTKLILFKQKTLVCRSTTYLRSWHWNLKPEFQQNCNPMPTFKSHALYTVLTRETPIRCEDEEDLRTVGNLYKIVEWFQWRLTESSVDETASVIDPERWCSLLWACNDFQGLVFWRICSLFAPF
jgi:hypothetical protein